MTDIAKPNISTVWATSGNITAPSGPQQANGFDVSTVPPNSYWFNYLHNLIDNYLLHINQHGICRWDNATSYVIGSMVMGSDNSIYQSLIANNVNHDPTLDSGANWNGVFDSDPFSTSRPNVIIGGHFGNNLFQRGSSFSNVPLNQYVADRFLYIRGTNNTSQISTSADTINTVTPSLMNYFSLRSLKMQCTTAMSPVTGADTRGALCTIIEGYDFQECVNNNCTFTFAFYTTVPGIYCCAFQNNIQHNSGDYSYVTQFTAVANAWQIIKVNFGPSPLTGNWAFTNGQGLRAIVSLMPPGSTYVTSTLNTWITGEFYASSSQVNLMASNSNFCNFDLFKLEAGSIFTGFAQNDFALEYLQQLRYYEKSYHIGTAPGTISTASNYRQGAVYAPGYYYFSVPYQAAKRETSDVGGVTTTLYSNSVSSNTQWDFAGSFSATVTVLASDTNKLDLTLSDAGITTVGTVFGHWTTDADFLVT